MKLKVFDWRTHNFFNLFHVPYQVALLLDNGPDKRGTLFLVAYFGSPVNSINPGVIL